MTRPLLIRGARIIDPAAKLDLIGDLLAFDGRVADIAPALHAAPDGARIIEAAGLTLTPGLVDMRAQLGEPGQEHREDVVSAAHAAVAGGITTLACLPNTDPVVDRPSLVTHLLRRSDEVGAARILPYAAVTRGAAGQQLSEMGVLTDAGAVGFTDGPRHALDAQTLRRALDYARAFDQLVFGWPEEPSLSANAAMTSGLLATRMGLPAAPAVAERMMVERDVHLAELTGGRLHLGPITTAGAVEAIRAAKARGVRVTADTAPHYFILNELALIGYVTDAKTCPPLRCDDDRRAVIAGLVDGTIDAIASDHRPADRDSKRLPFNQAAFGIAGLETLLALSLELVHSGALDLSTLLRRLTFAPAEILRRPCGRLSVGAPADLTLFDPDRPWVIDVTAFRSKSRNSPFHRKPTQGVVVATIVGGRVVFGAGA